MLDTTLSLRKSIVFFSVLFFSSQLFAEDINAKLIATVVQAPCVPKQSDQTIDFGTLESSIFTEGAGLSSEKSLVFAFDCPVGTTQITLAFDSDAKGGVSNASLYNQETEGVTGIAVMVHQPNSALHIHFGATDLNGTTTISVPEAGGEVESGIYSAYLTKVTDQAFSLGTGDFLTTMTASAIYD